MGKAMEDAVKRLREIRQKNLAGGGLEAIERQHARGKLTARERIECLVDPGTFSELGSCVNTNSRRIDGKEVDAPCDGAVIGTGEVEGRLVAVYASDFTVLGGSIGSQHLQKCAELIKMAAAWGIPMVWLLDSSGGRLGSSTLLTAGIDWYFALEARYSGVIPQINVLMGPCIAGQAYAPTLCDFLLMSRQTGHLWLGGPRMVQAATSEKIGDNVGGADYHMEFSGTCDVVGEDDRETIQKARLLLGYLPSNWREKAPYKPTCDDPRREVPELAEIVPDDYGETYDMHRVIELLVDDGEYFELKNEYAKNLITCFARMGGEVVGLVANNPAQPGSILEIDSCDKYYRFLQVLDAYNIPLVTLVDTPPVVPGESQEARGLLRHGGKILDVYATATIPKISVILREAYGDAGSIIMGGVKGMGVDLCYAWPVARFAIEASEMDYRNVRGGMGIEAGAYEGYLNRAREKLDVFEVAKCWTAQVVDEIIEPGETRKKIIEALRLTKNKREKLPPRNKYHGTPPT
ncbi:propionyl-CoA carboxylase [Desulfallas sp. Bu1-1]|jgi:propionyl-CoA carboxylase beta chain|uniref:acyl-CoA carboxylase subunit beta n=1 Tax=Desulfallas sp. Bu1-1 TaxID=2787620 RepID=UPI00189F4D37|nr:carboxyl transferase domain-containing protein [Desulfallas sp. Bu1-1]MBF7082272.1 propionyl-CoA carboxylase [Desulfallas sp. Bu1-1]